MLCVCQPRWRRHPAVVTLKSKGRTALCILTQKGQNGPQDGKDDGRPNDSFPPLWTLVHLSLALADGCPEDGQV